MGVPYIGFGNDELKNNPTVEIGMTIVCPNCNGLHKLEAGTVNGKLSHAMYFVKCAEKTYLAAVQKKLVINQNPSMSNEKGRV